VRTTTLKSFILKKSLIKTRQFLLKIADLQKTNEGTALTPTDWSNETESLAQMLTLKPF
jgi:hypothetical protein